VTDLDNRTSATKRKARRKGYVLPSLARLYRGFKWTLRSLLFVAVLMLLGNVVFHSRRGTPYRALDPNAAPCLSESGWEVLSNSSDKQVANDEWSAIDNNGSDWRVKFSCAIQRHAIPDYRAADGTLRRLTYDFGFLEFDEDGKPYALRQLCTKTDKDCEDEGYGSVKWASLERGAAQGQLRAILRRIDPEDANYVMVFIHGWRHDASIGDANVSEFRLYAAHAARFIEDRWTDQTKPKPHVTAIFIGWRGARTDETWLARHLGAFGAHIGNFSAILTLFDRKPVSETIAPSVLSGLRAIEQRLHLSDALPAGAPPKTNKMIIFGHSLGGNMLATALQDDLVKKVAMHKPASYMFPVLGDLVVLINPASEATKWMSFQRAVWSRIATGADERRPPEEYAASHDFFPRNQRPIVISVTAARDWPPGGRRELDCRSAAVGTAAVEEEENRANAKEGFNYDWATYDMFPAFKGDLRPFADTLWRIALGVDPHDACDETPVSKLRHVVSAPLVALSALLRILPFMQTDPEQTHTIGNLDPPRAPRGSLSDDYVTAHPFGTTHELRGLDLATSAVVRFTNKPVDSEPRREIPASYNQVIEPEAACPIAASWLISARNEIERRDRQKNPPGENHGMRWTSTLSTPNQPALIFRHGFDMAGIAPITRANDPFWNMRAFDSALARHDGYMLSSFICAINQMVLDDITEAKAPIVNNTSAPQAPAAIPGAGGP
jgi:hypothetical protein